MIRVLEGSPFLDSEGGREGQFTPTIHKVENRNRSNKETTSIRKAPHIYKSIN